MRNNFYLVLSVVIALGGCAKEAVQTTKNAVPNSIASRLILNGALASTMVSGLRMDNTGPFIKVEATLYNASSGYDVIYYRFRWYNSSGMTVGSEEAWKTIPLLEKSTQTLIGVATSREAVDFKLELQSPNNTGEN